MAGLMAEVVEDHVRMHLVDAEQHPGALNTEAAKLLLELSALTSNEGRHH